MAKRQLSDGDDEGTTLGQSTTDKISFYNVTTVTQQSVGSLVSTGTPLTAIGSAVLTLQNLLRTYGLSS